MERDGVYASRWPQDNRTLWTIVNRNEYDVSGLQMNVSSTPGVHFFDLYHGVELQPQIEQGKVAISFRLEAHGFSAILAVDGPVDEVTRQLLAKMKIITANDLATYAYEWSPIEEHMIEIPGTSPAPSTPPGMVRIDGGNFMFKVNGIEIEGSNDAGTDVQYPWENAPRRFHEHPMHISSFLHRRISSHEC
jgi:iron(II)-dependent oxidoreductase